MPACCSVCLTVIRSNSVHRTFVLLLQSAITFHGCKVSYKQSRAFRDRGRAAIMELAYPKTSLETFFSDVKHFFLKKNLDFL